MEQGRGTRDEGRGRGPRDDRLPFPGELLDSGPDVAAAVAEPEEAAAPSARPSSLVPRPSLVIQTSFIGDMVLTTPLIAELATRGPVDVVATPANAPLLANNPSVRRVVRYDKRGDDRGMYGLWRTARALRARGREGAEGAEGPYAAAYLAQGSMRSAVLAVLAGVRERVGFASSAGRALYTRCVAYREDLHHAERLWRLAARPGDERPSAARLRPRLFPGDAEVAAVDRLLRGAGYGGEPLVVLAPGSIWATKQWPYYPALARRLAGHARLAIVGGPRDAAPARAIADAIAPARAIDAVGALSVLGAAELVGRAALLVTNDSAPQHLASAMGTPTVAIFGPTVPEFGFGPLAPRRAVVGHRGLACRPCDRHGPPRCPLGHWRCMRELPAEHVERVALDLLAASPLTS